jgi:hypothetical protein
MLCRDRGMRARLLGADEASGQFHASRIGSALHSLILRGLPEEMLTDSGALAAHYFPAS